MQGQLFSTDFVLRGITETEPWRALSDATKDMKTFGSFCSCDLILAYLARITAGQLLHENIVLPENSGAATLGS